MRLTIGGLAAQAGVGVETVRYYQRRGLLPVPPGSDGVRRYGAEDVRTLRFIRRAQAAGFTLAQIGELLALDATTDRARVRTLAEHRIAALDEQIAQLQEVRASLADLARDCAEGTSGPCPIVTRLEGSAVRPQHRT